MLRSHATTLLAALVLTLVTGGWAPGGPEPFAALAGCWRGSAEIIMSWCDQKDLPIELRIHPDGRVEGTVGGATLLEARLEHNSGFLVALGNSKLVIRGRLEGDIVPAESIRRGAVRLFLDPSEDGSELTGGLRTGGSKFGGRESMQLTASDLVLRRCPAGESPPHPAR